MVTLSIILALAFTWLLYETDWMRVRLPGRESLAQYDKRILEAMQIEWDNDKSYRDWLAKRYEPKLKYGVADTDAVDLPNKGQAADDDLRARRNGEMIYQRGGAQGYSQLSRRQRELVGL